MLLDSSWMSRSRDEGRMLLLVYYIIKQGWRSWILAPQYCYVLADIDSSAHRAREGEPRN